MHPHKLARSMLQLHSHGHAGSYQLQPRCVCLSAHRIYRLGTNRTSPSHLPVRLDHTPSSCGSLVSTYGLQLVVVLPLRVVTGHVPQTTGRLPPAANNYAVNHGHRHSYP